MANIELDALETLDIKAQRTDDEAGDVTLVIRTDDGTVRVRCGRTADDADRVTEALALATGQSAKVADDWYERPDENDGFVTLSNYRWYVTLEGMSPGGQPASGYPDGTVAIYELAALMAEHGCFPGAWAEGEHGPSERDINSEVRAFHDEGGDKLLPLDGVEYEPGDRVRYDGDTSMEIVRDYGQLGLWLAVAGDYSAGETFVTDRSLVQPAYQPGEVIEYVSQAWTASEATRGQRVPGLFVQYDADSAQHVYVRTLNRPEPIRRPATEVRPVPASVLSAARSWVADNAWEDIADEGDVADLSDATVVRGVQRHADGGWAEFRRAVQ